MKKTMAFLAILLGALSVYLGWSHLNFIEQKRMEKEKNIAEQEMVHKAWNDLENISSEEIDKLPKSVQARTRSVKELKEAIASFEEAEDYLAKAAQLAQTASSSDKIHPLVTVYYESAIASYKKSKEIIDRLEEVEGDNEYNHCFNYTKGEIYYRTLQLMAKDEEKMEIFRQIVQAFKRALLAKPRDIDTEINVEILRVKRSQLLSGAAMPTEQLLRQLPQTGSGKGGRKGKF